MSIDTVLNATAIVDADAHIVAPPDLWTSRVVDKFVDRVPRPRFDDELGEDVWYLDDTRLLSPEARAAAGPTGAPAWDSTDRLAQLDARGIGAQVLYAEVSSDIARTFLDAGERDIVNICVQAYNDYLADFAAVAPDRYVPIAALQFWDVELALKEMGRCASMGHRGFVMPEDPTEFGLPALDSTEWDRVWGAAARLDMSINLRVGGPDRRASLRRTLSSLTVGGVCHRFPDVRFVLSEGRVGWLPDALESLDRERRAAGQAGDDTDRLLPSEYFRRQIYVPSTFDDASEVTAAQQYSENVLLQIGATEAPAEHLREAFAVLSDETAHKVIHSNAHRVFRLG